MGKNEVELMDREVELHAIVTKTIPPLGITTSNPTESSTVVRTEGTVFLVIHVFLLGERLLKYIQRPLIQCEY